MKKISDPKLSNPTCFYCSFGLLYDFYKLRRNCSSRIIFPQAVDYRCCIYFSYVNNCQMNNGAQTDLESYSGSILVRFLPGKPSRASVRFPVGGPNILPAVARAISMEDLLSCFLFPINRLRANIDCVYDFYGIQRS